MVERLRATQTCNSLSDNRSSAYSSDTEDSCGGNASALMFAPLRFHGLSNRTGENNCFMNAVVQCLLHVPTFVHGFMLLPHRCLDEKCVPCTFRKLMHKYVKDGHQSNADDQEKLGKKTYVVNGTQLRQVISDACVQKGLFQVQEMNDAMEACEELLKLLGKRNTAVGATEESTSGSAIESVFTSRVITYGCCNKCGAKRREMQYAQIIQYIRAANLAKVGLAAELMNQQSDVPHSCDQSGCTEGMVEYLRIVPTTGSALLLGVIWRVKCSREDLKEFIQALPQAITSQDIQGKLARWNRPFRLRGFVAFAALHYVAFVRKGNADDWILFDDANVKERGNWENVIDKLVSGKLQPLILFYDSLDIMVNNTQGSSPIPKESAPSTSVSDGYLSKRGSQPLSPLKNSQGARPTSTFEVNSPHPSSRYTDRGQVTHSDFGNRPSESPNRKNPGDHSFNASFYYKARVDERKKSLLSTKEQMRMLSYSHSHHSPKASPKGERGMLPHAPHQTTDSKRTFFADLPRSPMHHRPQPVLLPKNRPVVMPSDFVSSPKNVDVAPLVSTRIRSPRQHTDGAPFSSMSSAYRHTNTAFTSTSPQSALSPRNCYSHGEHLKSPVNAGRVTHIVSSPSNYHGLGSSRSVNEIMNSLPAQHYTSYRMQEVPLSFPKPIPHSPLASTAYPYASSAPLKSPHSRTRGQIGNSMHYGADVTSPHRIISPRGDAMRQGGQSPFSSRNFMESSSVKHKPTRTVQFESNATQQKDQTKALNYFSSRPFYSML